MDDNAKKASSPSTQVVIDLGKKSRKSIKKLRRGEGKLADTIEAQLAALRTQGAIGADTNTVVVVAERKPELSGRRMRIF